VTLLKSKRLFRQISSVACCALVSVLYTGEVAASACLDTNHEALQWLDKMSRSAHEVSYQGVVTFQRGDDMQVMQIFHSVTGDAASESLTQLTGQGAQVVRVDHPLQCIHPGHKLLRLGAAGLPETSGVDSCGLAQYYRFSVTEGERIAGRRAVRIQITPRDMYRYGYVMELDNQTGLLLKTRTVDRGGKVLERFQFAKLSYSDDVDQGVDVEVVHRATHPGSTAAGPGNQISNGQWAVRWLPDGFILTDAPNRDTRRRSYTDGLAVFSVFLEVLPGGIKPGEGVVHRGGTTSYTRGLRLAGNSALVTVIGEVPLNTARMVADSISWTQN